MIEVAIGSIIKKSRIECNMSQKELCEEICTIRYLSKVENNKAIPTIDIVSRFSARLGINLYDECALVLKYNNIETYKIIAEINEYLSSERIKDIRPLLDSLKNNKDFEIGEPFQIYRYAQACYESHVNKDISKSLELSLEAMDLKYSNIKELMRKSNLFSNVELNILLHIACEYYRLDLKDDSIFYFNLLIHNILDILKNEKRSMINRRLHFYLNYIGKTFYMFYMYYPDEAIDYIEYYKEAIDILKKYNYMLNLAELLLIYSKMLYEIGEKKEAKRYQTDGINIQEMNSNHDEAINLLTFIDSIQDSSKHMD